MEIEYNINPENLSLDHKQALTHLSRKLKEVLNPFINTGSSYYGIKILTDIALPTEEIISFRVNCLSSAGISSKTIQVIGYFEGTSNSLLLSNQGQERINYAGLTSEDDKLIIILSHEGKGTDELLKSEAEIFVSSNNRNHVTGIEFLTQEQYDSYESILAPVEESGVNSGFSFTVNTGDDQYIITNGSFDKTINKVAVAKRADSLRQNVAIAVNQGIQSPDIVGSGTIYGDTLEGELNLEVNITPIVNRVKEEFEIPVATDEVIGGINVAGQSQLFTGNNYPVKLMQVGNANYAYVDLDNFQNTLDLDKHRYVSMTDASVEHPGLGEVVLYIGPTTSLYTHGYFYMRVRELIVGEPSTNNTYWLCPDTSVLNEALTEYNKQQDHILVIGSTLYPLVITPNLTEDGTITPTTEFTITNNAFSSIITYGDLTNFGISLSDLNYVHTDRSKFSLEISLKYVEPENPDNPKLWVLKNVQPPIHMQSALVYKGTCTWAELQAKISYSQPGDFWTVSDKSYQEYFFTDQGTWEFMGDVFTNNGSYSVKTKVGNTTETVSTFEANQSVGTDITFIQGSNVTITPDTTNHTVEIAATDTTYSAGSNISIDTSNSNAISALGYTYNATKNSFSESSGIAIGTDSHAEGNVETTPLMGEWSYNDNSLTINQDTGSGPLPEPFSLVAIPDGDTIAYRMVMGTAWTNKFMIDRKIKHGATDVYIESVLGGIAYGDYSHVEGSSYAVGNYSHAEGLNTHTVGANSHSEGQNTEARGAHSHAEGYYTISKRSSSHAEGAYNQSFDDAIHMVGIGTAENARKNAHLILYDGKHYIPDIGGYQGTETSLTGISDLATVVNNKFDTSGGTLTGQVYYNESGTVTTTVTCTRKYNWLEVDDNDSNVINGAVTLSITMPSTLSGPCEVIYAIKNNNAADGNDIVLNLPSTGHNMTSVTSFTIPPQKIAEIVFTFWSTTDVSFNGGVEL